MECGQRLHTSLATKFIIIFNMKLIHLNVESFKYFDALVDFLEIEKPDIISLVEATDGAFFGSKGGEKRDYL